MSKPNVSVVMPVYNSAKYLKECLNSLVRQTLKDIEIICVDDGSNDESLGILNEFHEHDDRILVFTQENQGAAEARNRGLKIAKGRYVIFLDSDDVFESDMLEKMYCKVEDSNVEMAICNFDVLAKRFESNNEYDMRKKHAYAGAFDITKLPLNGLVEFVHANPWTKLIRKSFLIDNNIVFQNQKSANDLYFSYLAGLLAKSMCYINDAAPKVHYRMNITSQISANRSVLDVYNAFKRLYEEAIFRNLDSNKIKYIYVSALIHISRELLSGTGDSKDQKKHFFNFFQKEGVLAFCSDFFSTDLGSYNELLRFFLHEAYDAKRLRQTLVKTQLEFSAEKKKALFDFCCNKKTVFWGIGEYGQCILPECNKIGLHFSYVCDGKKNGQFAFGYDIVSFSDIKEGIDCVFVSTNKFFSDICKEIESIATQSVEVVNLARFLTDDCNIKDCIVCVEPILKPND